MYKLLIILSLFLAAAASASAQFPLTQQQQSQLSGNQRKLKARQDSALSAPSRYLNAGKPNPTPSKDAPSPKPTPRLAVVDTMPGPEPQKLVPSLDHTSCKAVTYVPVPVDSGDFVVTRTPPSVPPATEPPPHVPFLTIHGNVLYNLNYYSRIDTPYNETNIYQHTIQTWLDVLIKGQYPFRIFLTNHFSNSSLFRNYSDFNFGYNNNAFAQLIRDQLRREFLTSLPDQRLLDSLQRVLKTDYMKLKGLEGFGKNPSLIQKAVEDKEAAAAGKKTDSIKLDADGYEAIYASIRHDADSLQREIATLLQLLRTARQHLNTNTSQGLASISRLDNPAQLSKEMAALGLSDSSLPRGYKTLMAVKSFAIGRSVVNYSELSAKNILVNGVQAEYNPSNYYAFAAGTVDYRFRDFVIQQPGQPRQYLDIFRFGKGLKDGNSIILTYFMGKRQLFNAATADTPATQVPSSFLMGMTLEGNYHLTRNILFTGEIAKSSSPGYIKDSTKGTSAGASMLSMNDHSNEAWSMKLNAFFPQTQTRIRGSYKHLASNYQSFSIFTDGSSQSAWSANVDQLLFRKQLDIAIGANTNDFSNPFISQEYRSTTVFKSIQATFRRKNWPVVSLGYFPSSQITKIGNGQYIENLFYTLIGNMTHSYIWHHLMMNTTAIYTQFYNRASDSGFTYFNTRNLLVSQSLFLNRLTLQMNASAATNTDYQLYTLEGKAQQTIGKVLTIGAGIKYNKQTAYNIDEFGYSAEMGLRLKHLGQIQFTAEKGFLPGMNKVLVPDNTGRLTYLKTF